MLTAILTVTLAILAVAVLASIYFMNQMIFEGEEALSEELSRNLASEVEQKASKTEAELDAYKNYMQVIRDYLQNMYPNREELIATGRFVDSSRVEIGNEYAMQTAFASENYNLDSYHDEMYFFSHLESLFEPIAKNNQEQITTIYFGTKSGLMMSYDRWALLSAVPEPDFFVYDYFQSEWYTKGMKEDRVFFTSLYTDAMGRGLTITVASPFKDTNGEVQGVLAADFDITSMYDEMISMDLGNGSSTFAVDENHDIISIDSEEEIKLESYVPLGSDYLAQMTSGESGIIETDDALYAYAPVKNVGWTLCAKVPRTVLMEKVNALDNSFNKAMFFFLLSSIALVLIGVYLSNRTSKSIIRPIEQLVDDMQIIANGDLDHEAVVYQNDEIGDMTIRLNEMVDRLKGTIRDLETAQMEAAQMQKIASTDPLTSVKSRGAFVNYMQALQDELDVETDIEFAIGVFDCDDTKSINDHYGHDKGDEYLIGASRLICHVFKHSPVFRTGGDEFAVCLRGEDYNNREALTESFVKEQKSICEQSDSPWKQIHISLGVAVYDSSIDKTATDTMRHADKVMYEYKSLQKTQ